MKHNNLGLTCRLATAILAVVAFAAFRSGSAWSQSFKYPPEMPGAETEV